ncbi:unnamed protein product [Clonostachys rosea]|uniref:Uncharacterized protein n=1 Tax=Bionectria ochroleuca TaxID=29856 RepID=A0ABY6TUQ6_BIOOC|nr:unnamed protein product [Clonostachys rosea]
MSLIVASARLPKDVRRRRAVSSISVSNIVEMFAAREESPAPPRKRRSSVAVSLDDDNNLRTIFISWRE